MRSSSGTQPNAFTFTGEQTDAGTGLEYLRARYYDLALGRFMSRDPMAGTPAWNEHQYAYARSNPASRLDPTGMASESAVLAIPPVYCEVVDWDFRAVGRRKFPVLGITVRRPRLEAEASVWCETDVEEIEIEIAYIRDRGQVREIVHRDSRPCFAANECHFQ